MIAQWADAYKEELESLKGVVSDKQKMLEDYDKLSKVYMKQAEQFYVNFFTIAGLLKKDIFLSTITHRKNYQSVETGFKPVSTTLFIIPISF